MKSKICKIEYLANNPEFIDIVAHYWQQEWSVDKSEVGFAKRKAGIEQKLNTNWIPLIMIAIEGGVCVGTIALFDHDLKSRADLTPWLGGVFVAPEHRGRGVARELVNTAVSEAKDLGIKTLYLHTEGANGLYEKLGWSFMEDITNDHGESSKIYFLKTIKYRK